MLRRAAAVALAALLLLPLAPLGVASEPLTTKLHASDGRANHGYGRGIATDGTLVVVGATLDDAAGPSTGAAYVYRRSAAGWTEEAKLLAGDGEAGAFFGNSAAALGDTILVGAPGQDAGGAVYVFRHDGAAWEELAKLVPHDTALSQLFGRAVALHGDTAAIGAVTDSAVAPSAGAAYIFREGPDGWTEEAKLLASDAAAGDRFGVAVAMEDDAVVVGARDEDTAGTDAGAAYVFRRSGGTWAQEAKLVPAGAAAGDRAGEVVAMEDEAILLGANDGRGAVYAYRWDGAAWAAEGELVADVAADAAYGAAVALNRGIAFAGASLDDGLGDRAGAVFEFRRGEAGWTQQAKHLAPDGQAHDFFGSLLAAAAGVLAVAAAGDDDEGDFAGAAYALETRRPVGIDVRPGNDENTINPNGHGKVPVAILSAPGFDALDAVVQGTLTFGATGEEDSLDRCNEHGQDVNDDGLLDLVCRFRADATGVVSGDEEVILRGRTAAGEPFQGTDRVHVP